MKKISIGMALIAFSLTACEEKNKDYYLSHIDKAESKLASCEAELKQAVKAEDEAKIDKIYKDVECKSAKQALREHREAELERIRLEEEKKAQAAIAEQKAKIEKELSHLDWQGVAHYYVNNECSTKWMKKDDYTCLALKSFYEEKAQQGKEELSKKSLEALLSEKKAFCSKDKRQFSACDIWQQAVAEQGKSTFEQLSLVELYQKRNSEKYCEFDSPNYPACSAFRTVFKEKQNEVVNAYSQNYELLKTDYNQCVTALKKVGDHYSKYKEREAITDNYPCVETQQARNKLGLGYDSFKTLME